MDESEQARLVDEFCKVTGMDSQRARMYLEANGWNSDIAISSYFEEVDEGPESDEPEIVYPHPGSPKPDFRPTPQNRIATFASIANKDDEDSEEGQAFYAGGSERSGQQVLGPSKRKAGNELVEEMFKAVRRFGTEATEKSSTPQKPRPKIFQGAGHVLGHTEGSSSQVPGNSSQESGGRTVDVVLSMWQAGFTVDGGPLRDYDTPENRAFLEAVRRGEIPPELLKKGPAVEIHLNVEDRTEEVYIPKKPVLQAFSGTGFRLGNVTPVVQNASTEPDAKCVEDAQKNIELDESKPTTTIQIRLADGTRLTMQANYTHTVADVRRFIVSARPEYNAHVFSLATAFPVKELAEDDSTLEAQNLLNSVIVQKLKK